jgi:hypothetical protein
MDWKGKLQAARDAGQANLDEKAEVAIQENWPKVQQLFQEKVGPAALAAAQNDETMTKLFKVVYLALPMPVHIVVKEELFVKFCFAHRDRLLPPAPARGDKNVYV